MSQLSEDRWLSQLIGYPAYKLSLSQTTPDLSPLHQGKTFAYAKVDVDQLEQAHLAEDLGFHLVDTATYSEMPHTPAANPKTSTQIRFAQPEDADGVRELARQNFVFSRFHADPQFDNALANSIKAEWAGNFFTGQRGDGMVVALKQGLIVGFLQLLYKADLLVVDLIGVDRSARRQNIAADMTRFADQHCPPHQRMGVTTQVANIPALRLYEKLGFRLVSAQYIFHYHHA